MTLTIDQNLKIQITTGLSSSTKDVAQFLSTKKNWLLKHYKKIQDHQSQLQKKSENLIFAPGGKFPFLGTELLLKAVPTPLNRNFISISPPHLLLHLPMQTLPNPQPPSSDWIHKEVKKIFYNYAKHYLSHRTRFWAEQTGLIPARLSFKTQRSRWGSCSSNGRISLNLKLIVFPQEVIDYVIVHELCHLTHLNHSQNFWNLVAQHLPHYKKLSRVLKEDHWQTQFL